ncbi:hypothetical protein QTP86_011212 [Hemibagrus guttatus]|nr:hypothetical protein QTP86_011212 [Hemibagrus guttatus]
MVTYRPGSKNGKAKYSVTELRQRRKCSDPFAELAIGDEQRLSRKQAQMLVLLSVVVVSLFFSQGATFENQRLFINAVIRVQHLHQLAAKMMDDFEEALLPEERKQLSKTFPLSFCNSDSIEAPAGKDETQKSSVLKLLHTSYRLIESWELPSKNLGNPNHISEKLADLKMGIGVLIEGCLDGQTSLDENDALAPPFEDFYQTLSEGNLRKSFRLLSCFKKDMHKVETYLSVAKCRRSLDSNCTLALAAHV